MAAAKKVKPSDYGITVKPSGGHGKKIWVVRRNGKVVLTREKNSEACALATELALSMEEGTEQGKKDGEKKGAAVEKKKAAAVPTPTTGTNGPSAGTRKKTSKKIGKKGGR